MTKKNYQVGILSAEERRLVAFYRAQSPVLKEIIMNLTHFENGLRDTENAIINSETSLENKGSYSKNSSDSTD